jgi:ubiquinone biosynthesis protein
VKSINRLIKIKYTFIKHFLGFLKESLINRYRKTPPFSYQIFPNRLRLSFEELGPTFIKLGQLISMNPGIFPKSIIDEFTNCQDSMPPFSKEEAKEIIREEFRDKAPDILSNFEDEPLAAASIAQVHGAVLPNGENVVIKIQRRNIRKIVDIDISLLLLICKFIMAIYPRVRGANPLGIIKNFKELIHLELDFIKEGKNLERFSEIFYDDEAIVIPKIYWEYTTQKVLTIERFYGIKINSYMELKNSNMDLKKIARTGMKALIKTAFGHGFFHGDMHAGNVIILPDERYGVFDFGIVGSLDKEMRKQILTLLYSIYSNNFRAAGFILKDLLSGENVLLEQFLDDAERVGKEYLTTTLSGKKWMRFLAETLDSANKYHLKLPFPLILIFKQLLYLDGLGRMVDPDYDLLEDGQAYTSQFLRYMSSD